MLEENYEKNKLFLGLIDEYNNLILKYMGARLGEDNILECLSEGESKQLMKLLLKIRENMVEDCEKNPY